MVLNLFWCGLNYSKRSSKLFLTSCLSLDHHTPAAAPQHQPQQAELAPCLALEHPLAGGTEDSAAAPWA